MDLDCGMAIGKIRAMMTLWRESSQSGKHLEWFGG